jgi:hypothetical protein
LRQDSTLVAVEIAKQVGLSPDIVNVEAEVCGLAVALEQRRWLSLMSFR